MDSLKAALGAVSFGDPRGEFFSAHEASALFCLPGQTHVEIQGADRARFLHNFCTHDIKGLATGAGRELFVTSIQGKVLAHLFVFAGPDALWLSGTPGQGPALVAHLSRYQINEDVSFQDRTSALQSLLVAGPAAAALLGRLLGEQRVPSANLAHGECEWKGTRLFVRANGYLKVPAYELALSAEAAEDLFRELAAMSRPAGAAAYHTLRIEACFPLYGVDVSAANLAQEVGRTAQAISFTKGCYLGQEPIARIDALGHVNQQLRGIWLAGGAAPRAGDLVQTAGAAGAPIGKVTSGMVSARDDRPICLAYLRRQHNAAGTAVRVVTASEVLEGRVFA